ncbi:MAG: SUMF1/EgtB/PvdO family nonheme iron enzyme, partial [Anaerolineae bacterium]
MGILMVVVWNGRGVLEVRGMQTTPDAFKDFEIRIAPMGTGVYRVTVKLEEGDIFEGDFSTGGLSLWGSGGDPVQYGKDLFEALFADPNLHDAWIAARARNAQRRIRLWIDPDAAELHGLPWELLRDGDVWLATDDKTPFSRHLALALPRPDLLPAHPIRVLVVISNPDDLLEAYGLMEIKVAEERALVEEAFAEFLPPKRKGGMEVVERTCLEAPITLARLDKALGAGDGYHVLHFVGHGSFSQESKRAALFLQGDDGSAQLVEDREVANVIQRQKTCPRLIFLAACQSATRSTLDAFAGLGPRLIEAGVPAVVAMQDFVDVETARSMTSTFYGKLLRHGAVDRALNAARRNLDAAWRSDAYVPTLFMRREDGQLWYTANESGRAQVADKDLPRRWPHLRADLEAYRDDPSQSAFVHMLAGILLDGLIDNPTLEQVRHDLPWMVLFGELLFRIYTEKEKAAGTAIKADRFIDMLRRPREERVLPAEAQPSATKSPGGRVEELTPKKAEESHGRVRPRGDWEPELVFVPAGKFLMGTTKQQAAALRRQFDEPGWYKFDLETPQRPIDLPAYYIGKYPVTNVQYQVFVQETGHDRTPRHWENRQFPSGKDDHPVRGVYWKEAVAYCEWLTEKIQDAGCKIKVWRGGVLVTEELPRASCIVRLPTEAEWEKAARGPDGFEYPWGDFWVPARCNHSGSGIKDTTPVGAYSRYGGDSPYGCADMAGNVWEWTSTRWGPDWSEPQFIYPYRPDEREDMRSDDYRVVRGGSYWHSQEYLRCAARPLWSWGIYDDYDDSGVRVCVAAHSSLRL